MDEVFHADAAFGEALDDPVAHHVQLVLGHEHAIDSVLPVGYAGISKQRDSSLRLDMEELSDFLLSEIEMREDQRSALFKRKLQQRIEAVRHFKGQTLRVQLFAGGKAAHFLQIVIIAQADSTRKQKHACFTFSDFGILCTAKTQERLECNVKRIAPAAAQKIAERPGLGGPFFIISVKMTANL